MLELVKSFCSVVGFVFLGSCSAYDFPDPTPDDYAVHGIDISRWQGDIDWHEVKRSGVEFAWIKATEGGDHVDPRFLDNWIAARQAGVPRGAYHFFYFCRPVEEQIEWVKEIIPVDPKALPIVLDMEWNAHSKTCQKRPGRTHIHREMKLFLDEMEKHYGKRPVIYSSVDFHRDRLVGAFKNEQFWLRSVASYPNNIYEQRNDWVFWQYTAEGRVPGIRGDVDRNAFFGTKSQFRDWLNGKLRR
ncbi:glycoside hydrolase family 25 protein [Roseibium aggregatum]|uniref:Glycoside hydrolase family 25 protein n=1 Tax=Roseibium aggregatum TaxID=187304 RepID=A0A939EKK2_9HYPH|nr:glycoside hydrolase family 25 protein [Roseibium aggregatum]MBN9674033.1 glycoside hydrolase family 25 protein [Roseibium aggregatum]